MIIINLLVFFFIQLTIVKSDSPSSNPLIWYGISARIEDFPFFAATDSCGASILSDRWVLTAAHCVDNVMVTTKRIVYVGGDRLDNSIPYRYDQIIIYPLYRGQMSILIYDIALLRLQTPLTFSARVKPAKLPQWNSMNQMLQVVGRGQDQNRRPTVSLMKMDVIRLSPQECVKLTSSKEYHKFLLDQSIICGRRVDGKPGVCFGDSGGPLAQNNMVVGLVSFGLHRDCSKNNIGYYTNVASYVPWIKSITKLN